MKAISSAIFFATDQCSGDVVGEKLHETLQIEVMQLPVSEEEMKDVLGKLFEQFQNNLQKTEEGRKVFEKRGGLVVNIEDIFIAPLQ